MRTNKKTAIGIAAVGVLVLSLGVVAPANADYAPSGADAVGVGGDTPQYDLSFLADGDIAGNAGYNSSNNIKKFVSFDSVPDSNGRNGFDSTSTPALPVNLNPTIVLRAGTAPIQRPPSTGAGFTVFNLDTTKQINWIRTGRLPKASEQTTATANGWGSLHSIQIASDQVEIAAASTTNAPAGLTPADLLGIYKGDYLKWNQIPGNSAGSADNIIPLLPPTTSVIRTTLIDSLTALNGATFPLVSTVRVVQQNDPTAITTLTAAEKPNAITSFSKARLALWNANYFHNPAQSVPVAGTTLTAGVKLLTGTTLSGGAPYSDQIGHYIVFRESDYQTLGPWQAGSTKSWVKTLFFDGASGQPFIKRAPGQALIAASGATPQYTDKGSLSAG